VHALTVIAAMLRDMTTVGSAEDVRLLHTRSTLRTAQSLWVKIFSQPDIATLDVADVENWKIQVRDV
jgi:hypothetical protein